MLTFLKNNQKLIQYSLIIFLLLPIFGFKLIVGFLGNILLLLLLIPILFLIIALISFSSLKTNLSICNKCGTSALKVNGRCTNCGANLNENDIRSYENSNNPGEKTIEIKAEEIK